MIGSREFAAPRTPSRSWAQRADEGREAPPLRAPKIELAPNLAVTAPGRIGGDALESEIAETLAQVQLELTSLTKAVGGQLGGALAEAWPGGRRQEHLPAFALVLRVRGSTGG